ncbi:MAG: hypothetical protein AB1817_18735, partial [Chloroflexota bacterium]
MSHLNVVSSPTRKSTLNQAGINRLIQVIALTALVGVLLFLSAGRLDWMAAWVFLGLVLLVFLTAG